MDHHHDDIQPDFGTGQKTLGIYSIGMVACVILTLISFWAVMAGHFTRPQTFLIIYSSAIIQFFVQLICFLRLNAKTAQGRTNILAFVFTGVILMSIIIGSLWIMYSMNYNMMSM